VITNAAKLVVSRLHACARPDPTLINLRDPIQLQADKGGLSRIEPACVEDDFNEVGMGCRYFLVRIRADNFKVSRRHKADVGTFS
jgi:hypothetical protein